MPVKAFVFLEVNQGLYWVLCLSSTGHFRPFRGNGSDKCLLYIPATISLHSPPYISGLTGLYTVQAKRFRRDFTCTYFIRSAQAFEFCKVR